MGKVVLPRLNQTGANEWADVQANDEAITTVVNGGIDNSNIAAGAAIARSKLEPGAQGIPGTTYPAKIIATEQTTASTSFTTLATPDEITGVVVPTNALVRVGYLAIWASTASNGGVVALTFNGSAVGVATGGAQGTTGNLATHLLSTGLGASAVGPIASGQETGFVPSVAFPMVDVFVPAGTYNIAVVFKVTSGSVAVKERKLWVSVTTF